MRLTLSPKARSDLSDIRDFTAARWDTEQADRDIRQITRVFSDLADGSAPGHKADDIRAGYFRQPVGSHAIFFRRDPEGGIVVVRVLHQRMDPTLHM